MYGHVLVPLVFGKVHRQLLIESAQSLPVLQIYMIISKLASPEEFGEVVRAINEKGPFQLD